MSVEPFPEEDAFQIRMPFEFYSHEVPYFSFLKISTLPDPSDRRNCRFTSEVSLATASTFYDTAVIVPHRKNVINQFKVCLLYTSDAADE